MAAYHWLAFCPQCSCHCYNRFLNKSTQISKEEVISKQVSSCIYNKKNPLEDGFTLYVFPVTDKKKKNHIKEFFGHELRLVVTECIMGHALQKLISCHCDSIQNFCCYNTCVKATNGSTQISLDSNGINVNKTC